MERDLIDERFSITILQNIQKKKSGSGSCVKKRLFVFQKRLQMSQISL